MSHERESKRVKQDTHEEKIKVGDEVRIVNLPAYPGLEGLVATVISLDDQYVDVELHKNKVVKRLKLEKVRKLLIGSIVELHGLVAAYKLNGQLGQCLSFDPETQRYTVQLPNGDEKKIKPQNVSFSAKYRSEPITLRQLKGLEEDIAGKVVVGRQAVARAIVQWGCVVPQVVSARTMIDWAKLENSDFRNKLFLSKQVSISTLPDSVKIVYLSWPRDELSCSVDAMTSEGVEERLAKLLREAGPLLEKQFDSQVYLVLPFGVVAGGGIPLINQATAHSYPAWFYLIDSLLLPTLPRETGEVSVIQRLDMVCAGKAGKEILGLSSRHRQSVKFGLDEILPSDGACADPKTVGIVKEIEKSIGVDKTDTKFRVVCHSL